MEKLAPDSSAFPPPLPPWAQLRHGRLRSTGKRRLARFAAGVLGLFAVRHLTRNGLTFLDIGSEHCSDTKETFPYGRFPQADDPFRFQPCTNRTRPPALDDGEPDKSWAGLYEPDPSHWSWGNRTESDNDSSNLDPYAGRGIYLCGYLDVPLDWTNATDSRITRLAVTKFQVSGLARAADGSGTSSDRGGRSERTIVVEPGGPGGSGTGYVWRMGERLSARLSGGQLDVLGWDPRGVNATQPAAACFPYDADRDRWWQLTHRYREVAGKETAGQLAVADAMYAATMRACRQTLGDLGRFVGTAMVARDLDAVRAALAEPQLTGYLVSYGTGIGQTYANLFPHRVGRVILDGTEFVPDEWQLGGFGWASLDNVTHAWRDGFLGECLAAGPQHCALARPGPRSVGSFPPTVDALEHRMARLFDDPRTWPHVAQMLFDLEYGNATIAAALTDNFVWQYDPSVPASGPETCPTVPGSAPASVPVSAPSSDELGMLVICADAFDAPQPPDGVRWWDRLWANMTQTSWISGNSRFYNVLPCRHYSDHWPKPAGVYRGPLNRTLANPVLLVAETYDPATPLRNGRRLAAAMGHPNARLVVHHGYGHSSNADPSDCTDTVLRDLILHGRIPEDSETPCYANEKPYLYGLGKQDSPSEDPVAVWQDHMREMMLWNPGLMRHGS
ncbi:peptidase s33, tripeptidyl-peptidase [Grosmannia clavigera kw1407]|uniref:Peptidase s33, tripeptidyl-peptidase n=1 Tax=Grosmannia clavigera (strain kw1407 / UAMH 11150) TaxID=655863 RepID=F0XCD4_GROCL|nr:peptidase s33, tripeptidyl-peptidase [Grosmannia clavigera kw1407]EFX04243.1 peptidase s33, tripeptidyl-peptidase [Grosmannia clavigera kw1407]